MKIKEFGQVQGWLDGEADRQVQIAANVDPNPNYPRQRVLVTVPNAYRDEHGRDQAIVLAFTAGAAEELIEHLCNAVMEVKLE